MTRTSFQLHPDHWGSQRPQKAFQTQQEQCSSCAWEFFSGSIHGFRTHRWWNLGVPNPWTWRAHCKETRKQHLEGVAMFVCGKKNNKVSCTIYRLVYAFMDSTSTDASDEVQHMLSWTVVHESICWYCCMECANRTPCRTKGNHHQGIVEVRSLQYLNYASLDLGHWPPTHQQSMKQWCYSTLVARTSNWYCLYCENMACQKCNCFPNSIRPSGSPHC